MDPPTYLFSGFALGTVLVTLQSTITATIIVLLQGEDKMALACIC